MILVTGARGFIGRHLVQSLFSEGFDVVPLYRNERADIQADGWGLDLVCPDHLASLGSVTPVPETVVHLAGRVDIALRPNKRDPGGAPEPGRVDVPALYAANVMATANLLEFCVSRGVKHLVFASSQAVYGIPPSETLSEDSPCAPLDHYAASKVCAEHLLRVGARQGIAVTALRIPGVYGEDRHSGVVYRFCRSAVTAQRITVEGALPLPIDVLHVMDVVSGLTKAVRHGGEGWACLNLATGEPCNLNILAEAVAELVPGCRVHDAAVPQPTVRLDPSRARERLGWQAQPRDERLKGIVRSIQKMEESRFPKEEAACP